MSENTPDPAELEQAEDDGEEAGDPGALDPGDFLDDAEVGEREPNPDAGEDLSDVPEGEVVDPNADDEDVDG